MSRPCSRTRPPSPLSPVITSSSVDSAALFGPTIPRPRGRPRSETIPQHRLGTEGQRDVFDLERGRVADHAQVPEPDPGSGFTSPVTCTSGARVLSTMTSSYG